MSPDQLKQNLRGVIAFTPTPFHDDERVDYDAGPRIDQARGSDANSRDLSGCAIKECADFERDASADPVGAFRSESWRVPGGQNVAAARHQRGGDLRGAEIDADGESLAHRCIGARAKFLDFVSIAFAYSA